MKALLVGLGAVGARSARQLLSSKAVSHLVVFSRNPAEAGARLAALGGGGALTLEPLTAPAFSEALTGAAVTLLTTPGPCRWEADASLAAGVPVVSTSDDPHEVRSLLALGPAATSAGIPAVVEPGWPRGLSCLLAAWAAALMDEVTEIHVASLGTGGPACARRHHAALREGVDEWRDGATVHRVGGSGSGSWFGSPDSMPVPTVARVEPVPTLCFLPGPSQGSGRSRRERRPRAATGSRPGCQCCVSLTRKERWVPCGSRSAGRGREPRKRSWSARAGGRLCWPVRWPPWRP